MDSGRFDELVKGLATGTTRRRVVRGLGGGVLAGAAALLGRNRAGAAGQAKQQLCHRTGDSAHPFVVISVAEPAWATHVAHGDTPFIDCCTDADCGNGDACSTVACVNGTCTQTEITCPEGDACHAVSCDPALGCTTLVTPDAPCTTASGATGICDADGGCQATTPAVPLTCPADAECQSQCPDAVGINCRCGTTFDTGDPVCYSWDHGCPGPNYCLTSDECGDGEACINLNGGCGGCDNYIQSQTGQSMGVCNRVCTAGN